jgi:hypothetical protein
LPGRSSLAQPAFARRGFLPLQRHKQCQLAHIASLNRQGNVQTFFALRSEEHLAATDGYVDVITVQLVADQYAL